LVDGEKPEKVKFDGTSLKALLKPGSKPQWADRFLITDSQRVRDPIMWRKSAVMSEKWRLVNGTELYDIDEDPSQKSNVAKSHPDQVSKMRAFYEEWWAELEPTFAETTEIYFGHPAATVITMTSHDWIQEVGTPWNQGHIRRGSGTNSKKGNPKNMLHKGHWPIKVLNAGTYEIALLRWPPEANKPINAALPAGPNVPGASRAFRANPGNSIQASKASLRIDGKVLETKPVGAKDVKVTFETKLTKGIHELSPYFHIPAGQLGAYYVVATQK
jgi:arylsulfatase B